MTRVRDAFAEVVGEIRALSDRAAMGLPETYAAPEAELLSAAASEVYGARPAELAGTIESAGAPLVRRLAAGLLLGLVGDPRIRVFEPQMIEIRGGQVWLGTAWEAVSEIVGRYRRQGVRRSWIEKECPRHRVELGTYAIARYPVTNAEFARFLEATGWDELPTGWSFGRFHPMCANQPVYSVSPAAAEAYADWLSTRTARRFRLPTEAEWEYAAAGPEGREFPWGAFALDCANTLESGLLMATPIGCFPKGASCFGVLDLAGNVEELTASPYAPYPNGCTVADDLSTQGRYRICRGGAFTRFRDLARCQRRHGTVNAALYPVSFRLVEDP